MTQTSSPSGLTWEDAKASTQAMENGIVARIPADQISAVDQMSTGILFSCSNDRHVWKGGTTVTLVPGVDAEDVVRSLEASFADDRFAIRTRQDVNWNYEVQLIARDGEENYLFSRDKSGDTLSIDSTSACFTLPAGVYPGGDF